VVVFRSSVFKCQNLCSPSKYEIFTLNITGSLVEIRSQRVGRISFLAI
jgi:hypothetical protein